MIILVGEVRGIKQRFRKFGCITGSLPSSYLGLPLGARYSVVSIWEGVERNLEDSWLFGKDNTSQRGGG